jgi:hypothetical protein
MKKRFGSVEIGIFAVVSMVFLNSTYSFLTGGPHGLTGGGRIPANEGRQNTATSSQSAPHSSRSSDNFIQMAAYETKCKKTGESFETTASKLQISGLICGKALPVAVRDPATSTTTPDATTKAVKPSGPVAKIQHLGTGFEAEIFPDISQAQVRFSTDYIQLNHGMNLIRLEFFGSGKSPKSYLYDLSVTKK